MDRFSRTTDDYEKTGRRNGYQVKVAVESTGNLRYFENVADKEGFRPSGPARLFHIVEGMKRPAGKHQHDQQHSQYLT
jgi:hypothetical protein